MSDIAIKVEVLGKEIAQKVNLAIVGFQKCATTSIKNYLMEHEEVLGHHQKEMTFFSIADEYEEGLQQAYKRYYPTLKFSSEYQYILAKHATLIRHEESIKRLYEHNPNAKIIVCLRNPVARAFSSYLMEMASGADLPDFTKTIKEAFISQERNCANWHYNVFIRLGQYVDYIENLQKYFDTKHIYYLNIEGFKKDPASGVNSILHWLQLKDKHEINYEKKHNDIKGVRYRWLGKLNQKVLREGNILKKIGKNIIPPNNQAAIGEFIRKLNKKNIKRPDIPFEAQKILEKHYLPYNERLYLLTGVKL